MSDEGEAAPVGAADAGDERSPREFDPRAIEALICPRTHARLDWDAERCELVSRKAGLAYPVRGGIPIMLESEARRLSE
jgi:uncharacterized protein YbaR (Trm112 family)